MLHYAATGEGRTLACGLRTLAAPLVDGRGVWFPLDQRSTCFRGYPMYTHILIPTDGSELAQKGVSHGLSLAKALGSKVSVITVTEPYPRVYGDGWAPGPDDYKHFEEQTGKAAAELLAGVKSEAERMGVSASTEHVPDSTAAPAIVEAAERLGCNLIVMSSHGRRGIARVLLGSQTSEVLAHSPVPVVVVK